MNHVTQKQHGLQGSIACPTICYSCLYFVTCIMVENPHKTFVWGSTNVTRGKYSEKGLFILWKYLLKLHVYTLPLYIIFNYAE